MTDTTEADATSLVTADDIEGLVESYTEFAQFLGITPAIGRIVNEGKATDPEKLDLLLAAADGRSRSRSALCICAQPDLLTVMADGAYRACRRGGRPRRTRRAP